MLKTTMALLIAFVIATGTLAGCYKMGKATGETVEEVKQGGQDFKQGYEDGKKSD